MINHKITVGLSSIYKCEGCLSDAMPHSGSEGILDYLISTPAIMAMIIDASSSLLDPLLPEDYITVGKFIELDHEKPTIIDGDISIIITVTKVDGDRIHLEITGHDAIGQVCRGKYERVIVNKNTLIDSAYRRAQNAANL
jgi:fluoroacetyl-CoA thioesterase